VRLLELLSDGRLWGIWGGTTAFFVGVAVLDAWTPKENPTLSTATLLLLAGTLATLCLGEERSAPAWWEGGIVGGGFVLLALPVWAPLAPTASALGRTTAGAFSTVLLWSAVASFYPKVEWLTLLAPALGLLPELEPFRALEPLSPLRAVEENRTLIRYALLSLMVVLALGWRGGKRPLAGTLS
jgi:hypothetical protein